MTTLRRQLASPQSSKSGFARQALAGLPTEELRESPAVVTGAARIAAVGGAIDPILKAVDFLDRRVFTGAFSLDATGAAVMPYPRGLAPEFSVHRRFRIRCKRPVLADEIMAIQVSVRADCFNIYEAAIARDMQSSAWLINSEFKLTFTPRSQQVRAATRANIAFSVSGRWNPTGPGDEDFAGRLIVVATGAMFLEISAPAGRVLVEGTDAYGPYRPCPHPAQADPNTPPAVPVTPPDHFGRGKGAGASRPSGRSGTDSRHLLPSGPTVTHAFFLTGQPVLSLAERNRLQAWLNQLGTAVLDQVRSGSIRVFVTGHASRSGNADQNLTLSARRAEVAARVLRDLLGPDARILFQGQGAAEAVGTDPNDQADRRATVRIQVPM